MDTKVLLAATMLSVFFFGAMGTASIASAQYMGNVDSGGDPVPSTPGEPLIGEPLIEVREEGIGPAEASPASGSGTPYLDADGVVGASAIAGAVFGGVAGAFFLRGRSDKYTAMGRG